MGSWFQGLRKTRERWAGALAGLFGGGKASEADWEELLDSGKMGYMALLRKP